MSDPTKKPSTASRSRRYVRRAATLPAGSQCATCQTTMLFTLSLKPDGRVLCYACDARERGLSGYEDHHVWGQRINPQVLRVPANLHRSLEAAKYEWPQAVLQNRDRRPVVLLAGFLFFLRDLGRLLMITCAAFAEWLLRIHAQLAAQTPRYEAALGFPSLTGEG